MKKYLAGLVLAGVLVGPGVALAESGYSTGAEKSREEMIAKLQKQVSELLAQIEKLKKGGSSESFCYAFNIDFGIGASGEDVAALRKGLASLGISTEGDGSFDEELAALVVKFQGKYGIRQTGYVGPLTRAKLNKLFGCNVSAEARAKELKVKKEIVEVKKEVKAEAKAAPVIVRLDGNTTKLVRGEWNYVIGQYLGVVKSATLTSSSGDKIALEFYLKGDETLKLMLPKNVAAGSYQLTLANSLGSSNGLNVEIE